MPENMSVSGHIACFTLDLKVNQSPRSRRGAIVMNSDDAKVLEDVVRFHSCLTHAEDFLETKVHAIIGLGRESTSSIYDALISVVADNKMNESFQVTQAVNTDHLVRLLLYIHVAGLFNEIQVFT